MRSARDDRHQLSPPHWLHAQRRNDVGELQRRCRHHDDEVSALMPLRRPAGLPRQCRAASPLPARAAYAPNTTRYAQREIMLIFSRHDESMTVASRVMQDSHAACRHTRLSRLHRHDDNAFHRLAAIYQ